jgi:hypothetical protein
VAPWLESEQHEKGGSVVRVQHEKAESKYLRAFTKRSLIMCNTTEHNLTSLLTVHGLYHRWREYNDDSKIHN